MNECDSGTITTGSLSDAEDAAREAVGVSDDVALTSTASAFITGHDLTGRRTSPSAALERFERLVGQVFG